MMSLTNPEAVVEALIKDGATVIPALSPEILSTLFEEMEDMKFEPQPTLVGSQHITQHFSSVTTFTKLSTFVDIAQTTAHALNTSLGKKIGTQIEFNDLSLQRYEASKAGERFAISPHFDHKTFINIIAIYLLQGESAFNICTDREGVHSKFLNVIEGDLILMRGNSFMGKVNRPLHFVGPLTRRRVTFTLRQNILKATSRP